MILEDHEALYLAKKFHAAYEKAAGREPEEFDPKSPAGILLISTCKSLIMDEVLTLC
jgi:hypothetical protein